MEEIVVYTPCGISRTKHCWNDNCFALLLQCKVIKVNEDYYRIDLHTTVSIDKWYW